MAVTVSTGFNGGGVPSGGANTTASWTPDGTSQALLNVTAYISTGSAPPVISSVTGNGLTWTSITNVSGDATGADRTIQYMIAAPAGGSAGAITINWSTVPGKATWVLDKIAGADSGLGSGILAQTAVTGTSSGANPSATLANALQSGSVTYAAAGWESSAGTLSAGTGYTALGQNTSQTLCWTFSEWNSAGSTTASATNSTTTNRHSIILIEIKVASSGVTGTATPTQAADTSSASGILIYSGTGTPVQAAETSSASGTVVNPVSGSASPIQTNQTASASGLLQYSGTAASTQAPNTSSATGILGYSGMVAVTQANQTASASGTFAAGGAIIGTAAPVQANQILAASGILGYSGSAGPTQANQLSAANGILRYSGTSSATQTSNISSGAGVVANPVTGTVAVTQMNQTAVVVGTFAALVSAGTAHAAVMTTAGAFAAISTAPAATSDVFTAAAAYAVTGTASTATGG